MLQIQEQIRELDGRVTGGMMRPRATEGTDSPKLTKLTETDDIESYLTTFEQLMRTYARSRRRDGP